MCKINNFKIKGLAYMKNIYIILVIFIVLLFTIVCGKSAIYAQQQTKSTKNLFINSLWGVGTGCLIAGAYTATKSDVNKDTWQKGFGIGATIGAIAGLSYGLAIETKYYRPFTPSASIKLYDSKTSSPEIGIFLNCFQYYF